jgi:hypothetical protein
MRIEKSLANGKSSSSRHHGRVRGLARLSKESRDLWWYVIVFSVGSAIASFIIFVPSWLFPAK